MSNPRPHHPIKLLWKSMNNRLLRKLTQVLPLAKPTLSLCTYTAERMAVLGEVSVQIRYSKYCGTHTLYVVEGAGPTLLGHDWLHFIPLALRLCQG